MKYLIAFTTFLLVVQFDQGVTYKTYTSVGLSLSMLTTGPPRNVTRCLATHNNVTYSIYPVLNLTNAIYDGLQKRCSFTVQSVKFDDGGNWTIRMNWTNINNTMFQNITVNEAYIDEGVDSIPTDTLRTVDGNYVTIFAQEIFNPLTNCTLMRRINRTAVESYNLLNASVTNPTMQRIGQCGVRLLVNESRRGHWHFYQASGPYKSRKYQFAIEKSNKYDKINEMNLWWSRGSTMNLQIFNTIHRYCSITRPDGQTLPLEKCSYEVQNVSVIHDGTWILRYSVPDMIDLLENIYYVRVYDSEYVNVTVNDTNTQQVHLMCKIPERNLRYCVYTSPKGISINLPEGVGNNKYEYYGNGYKRATGGGYADCGLTIRQPSNEDVGLWKCTLDTGNEILSAIVPYFGNKITNSVILHSSNHTYAKRGDQFTIKYKISAPLEYCWLLSPNGTIYTVANDDSSDKNTLPYEGEGLAMGVCGARIENASDEHAGNWSCRMGVVKGSEIEEILPVTITESYLYPKQSLINVIDNIKQTLICNILPDKKAIIKYCRWLRPDGYGIHEENSIDYFTSSEYKSCILEIKKYNIKNIGEWTCYAGLTGELNKEVFATIDIISENFYSNGVMSTVLNVLAIILLIITLVGTCFIGILSYRRKPWSKKQLGYCADYKIHENEMKIPSNIQKI